MGGKNTAAMKAGERIIINTPGGGGWGKVGDRKEVKETRDPKFGWKAGSHASREETALQA
jgi:5-oxoprolinase (ATP-hydrolysing)